MGDPPEAQESCMEVVRLIPKASNVSLELYTCHVMETSNIQLKMIIFIQIFSGSSLVRILLKSATSNLALKKVLTALFFMILGKLQGLASIFSQQGISQKLACKDLFIGSLRYCFDALKCILSICLTSQNGLAKCCLCLSTTVHLPRIWNRILVMGTIFSYDFDAVLCLVS